MTPSSIGQLDPDVFQPLTPGASDPAARLADMDAMVVDVAVVFPTLFTEYLPLVQNPYAAAVLAQAYNDWIWDFAAQARDRLHPVAVVPMHSALLAQRELDRVAAKGFTSVMIRPAFHVGPRIADHSPEGQMREAMRRMMTAASGGAGLGGASWWRTSPTARCGAISTN